MRERKKWGEREGGGEREMEMHFGGCRVFGMDWKDWEWLLCKQNMHLEVGCVMARRAGGVDGRRRDECCSAALGAARKEKKTAAFSFFLSFTFRRRTRHARALLLLLLLSSTSLSPAHAQTSSPYSPASPAARATKTASRLTRPRAASSAGRRGCRWARLSPRPCSWTEGCGGRRPGVAVPRP